MQSVNKLKDTYELASMKAEAFDKLNNMVICEMSDSDVVELIKREADRIKQYILKRNEDASEVRILSKEIFTGYFDGACEPNPGMMAIGTVLFNSDRHLIDSMSEFKGKGTNNIAEWMGLIILLERAIECNIRKLKVMGDSMLVINQINDKWRVKQDHLKPYKKLGDELKAKFEIITFSWIQRELNTEADALSKAGLACN
jgi:ribonuclease HI